MPWRGNGWCLFALQEKFEEIAVLTVFQQGVSGLPGEGGEILQGGRVGGEDTQNLAGGHVRQRFLGAQNGEGTTQAPDIKFSIK